MWVVGYINAGLAVRYRGLPFVPAKHAFVLNVFYTSVPLIAEKFGFVSVGAIRRSIGEAI